MHLSLFFFFFFNDTATTEIYTLSLHDALPIYLGIPLHSLFSWTVTFNLIILFSFVGGGWAAFRLAYEMTSSYPGRDRKSTRLNSSHSQISYAVFCLKKKNKLYEIKSIQLHMNS